MQKGHEWNMKGNECPKWKEMKNKITGNKWRLKGNGCKIIGHGWKLKGD
jgi:hypothetical protein